jgi:predicted transcriptional regulator
LERTDLDSVLGAVENPIRRRIIAKLSEEPNYQLQLSKELGVSQQLVAKHLLSMEDAGLVSTTLEDSPRGPQRKEYMLTKSLSITVDLAPSLFRARVLSFAPLPGMDEGGGHAQVAGRLNEILRYADEASRIGALVEIVNEVDLKLKQMEDQRAVLLYLRTLVLREAARASTKLGTSNRNQVLHYLMKEQRDSIIDMSSSLGLQRREVEDILQQLEREFTMLEQKGKEERV